MAEDKSEAKQDELPLGIPKEAPAAPIAPIEEPGIEEFLKDGVDVKGVSIDRVLEKEFKKVEKEEKARKEPKDEKPKDEKEPETKPELKKTAISDAERKRLGIPEKFKYMDDVVKWGSEAERELLVLKQEHSKTKEERTATEERLAKIEQALQRSTQANNPAGKSPEELLAEEQLLRQKLDNSPVEFVDEILSRVEARAVEKEKIKTQEDQQAALKDRVDKARVRYFSELDEIKSKYSEEEFKNEVFPALQEMAKAEPYMQSVANAHRIYLYNKILSERKSRDDAADKRSAKSQSASESSVPSLDESSDTDRKKLLAIDGAETLDALERAAGFRR